MVPLILIPIPIMFMDLVENNDSESARWVRVWCFACVDNPINPSVSHSATLAMMHALIGALVVAFYGACPHAPPPVGSGAPSHICGVLCCRVQAFRLSHITQRRYTPLAAFSLSLNVASLMLCADRDDTVYLVVAGRLADNGRYRLLLLQAGRRAVLGTCSDENKSQGVASHNKFRGSFIIGNTT